MAQHKALRGLSVFSVLGLCLLATPAHANTDNDSMTLQSIFNLQRSATEARLNGGPSVQQKRESRDLERLFDENSDLRLLKDYHPTVDRWTERNNRIRLSPYVGVWMYSGELDVRHHVSYGLRLSWEAPGFIAIHFEGATSALSRLEVKPGGSANARSSRHATGLVSNFYLSVAIFNPELSNEDLAFWAGVGGGFWYFMFDEDSVQNGAIPTDVEFEDYVPSAKVFFEIDYRISQTLHIGFTFATHVLYAKFTDDGRFYDVNGISGGVGAGGALTQEGRNNSFFGHLALVTEGNLSISLVF